MTKKRPIGRPMKINQTIVNAICVAAEQETLSKEMICTRFAINRVTFKQWYELGREVSKGEVYENGLRAILSKQLFQRLSAIYNAHEERLIDRIKQPDAAEVARLVLCLSPEFSLLEAAG